MFKIPELTLGSFLGLFTSHQNFCGTSYFVSIYCSYTAQFGFYSKKLLFSVGLWSGGSFDHSLFGGLQGPDCSSSFWSSSGPLDLPLITVCQAAPISVAVITLPYWLFWIEQVDQMPHCFLVKTHSYHKCWYYTHLVVSKGLFLLIHISGFVGTLHWPGCITSIIYYFFFTLPFKKLYWHCYLLALLSLNMLIKRFSSDSEQK